MHELVDTNISCILEYADSLSTDLLICEHLNFQERGYPEFIDAELCVKL